jgi:hypothetical protein
MGELTLRQRAFVQAYTGNAAVAARQAGYSERTCRAIGQRLLTQVDIKQALREREQERLNPLIASREQRQEFWTQTMLDDSQEMQHRLKAAELLGRSEGDFMERLQIDQDVTVTVGYLFEPNQRRALLAEIEEEE